LPGLLGISVKTVEYHIGNALKRLTRDIANSHKSVTSADLNIFLEKK